MPRYARLVLGFLLLPAATGLAFTSDPNLLGLRDQIELAYNRGDIPGIEAAREALLATPAASSQRAFAEYLAAYGRLRESMVAADREDKPAASRYLDDCIDELKPVVAAHPGFAEARALLGSCYGASTTYHVLSSTVRGMKGGQQLAEALKIAPDNPWVVFQNGVSDYSTPAIFGGSDKQALKRLLRAAELFAAARPPGSTSPAWGEAEAWLYIGRVYQSLNQPAQAREALQKASRLAPDNPYIRQTLTSLD
jgi:cytochrome c-type biogenesis protein CcmH/NrfG